MSAVTKLMTAGGGGVALTPASSIASDVTVNVPSQNCTLDIQGPAFSAYQSVGQTFSANTETKIQFNSEEFDTANCFDSTTNYRFTPNVAGYYQVTVAAAPNSADTTMHITIYKNGSAFKRGVSTISPAGDGVLASALVYLNGSTDYIEGYWYTGTTQNAAANYLYTFFQAFLARSA